MSKFKIFDGTNWVDPCDCKVNIRKTDNTWQLLDPANCPTRYWTGTSWCLIECGCVCPDGYTYNPETNQCEIIEILPATPSAGVTYGIIDGNRNTAYGTYGSRLYQDISSANFPINGYASGTYVIKDNAGLGVPISITNLVTSGSDIFVAGGSSTKGRLNRCGIWGYLSSAFPAPNPLPSNDPNKWPNGDWFTVEFCVNITETKTYIFALAGDNQVRASIKSDTFNPELIPGPAPYTTNIVNLWASNSNTGSSPTSSISEPFRWWHMFPITLPAGSHTFILEGYNIDSFVSFGAELYDITTLELIDWMTSTVPTLVPGSMPAAYLPKNDNILAFEETILFSSRSLVTTPPILVAGTGETITWSCPPGSTFSECFGAPACIITTSVPCGGA